MSLRAARCKGADGKVCTTDVAWITLHPSGAKVLINYEAVPGEPKAKLALVNYSTGKGQILSQKDVDEGRAAAWMAKHNMTLHRVHFSDNKCPVVQARRRAHQERKARLEAEKTKGIALDVG